MLGSTVYQPVALGGTSISEFVSSAFRVSPASFFSVAREINYVGQVFRTFLFNIAVTPEKFGKTRKYVAKV